MKALIILTSGFEDVEAIATIDILKRSGIEVTSAYLTYPSIISQSGLNLTIDDCIDNVVLKHYDLLIIPGGKAVMESLDKSSKIDEVLEYFYSNKKLICLICAAPRLAVKKGYFKDLNFTIFPGCLTGIEKVLGNNLNTGVVVEENFITAKSMYYSIEFALAIVNKVLGSKIKDKTEKQIKGELL